MTTSASDDTVPMTLLAELAPRGVLRVGVNLSNFLLVVGENEGQHWAHVVGRGP